MTKPDLSRATSRPWKAIVNAGGQLWGLSAVESGNMVAEMWPMDYAKANAALIVEAVNSYDALSETLRELLAIVEHDYGEHTDHDDCDPQMCAETTAIIERARKLLEETR